MEQKLKRIQAIDLVKVLALSLVVAMHFQNARQEVGFEEINQTLVRPLTGVAMPLFFVVSGYLMCNHKGGARYGWKKIWNILKFCFIICTSMTVLRYVKSGGVNLEFFFPDCFLGTGWFYFYWYFGSMMIIYALLPVLKKVMASSRLHLYLIGLGVVCTVAFMANVMCDFEEKIVPGTFRLWDWLFYFLLGAIVCKCPEKFRWLKWYYVIPAALLYIALFQWLQLGGNSHYFSSPLCMLFTLSVFCAILHAPVQGNRLVSMLSDSFLPVYTFHSFLGLALCKVGLFNLLEQLLPTSLAYCVELAVTLVVCFAFGVIFMRIPYAKRIFRI